MNPAHLAGLLEQDGDAYAACRRAVLSGATISISEAGQPASMLASIYARRQRHTRQVGIPTLGFATAVQQLQDQGQQILRVAAVNIDDPPFHFHLFLNEDLSAALACIGIGIGIGIDHRTDHSLRAGDQVLLECEIIILESEDFPGWIRASVTDAVDRIWSFVEKAPVLGVDLDPHAPQPPTAGIRGTVVRELPDDNLDPPARLIVSTAVDGVSAEDGTVEFTVARKSVRRLPT